MRTACPCPHRQEVVVVLRSIVHNYSYREMSLAGILHVPRPLVLHYVAATGSMSSAAAAAVQRLLEQIQRCLEDETTSDAEHIDPLLKQLAKVSRSDTPHSTSDHA
jgi:hypothetical protein